MNFVFGEDQLALRDAVRALLEKECTPDDVRASWKTETGRSPQRWQALADMGVLGLVVPEQFGGRGLDETWLVLLLEEAGRAALPEPLGPVTVATGLIVDAAPEPSRQEWLPRIVSGEVIVVTSLPTSTWVDDAHVADLLLVAADGEQLHVIDPSVVELEAAPTSDPSRRMYSFAAKVSARSCLADRAGSAIARAVDRNDLAAAAYLLGSAGRLVDLTKSCVLEREQRSARGASFRAIQEQLASALDQIELARHAVYQAAWSIAHDAAGRSDHAQMARTLASQAAQLAGRTALDGHEAIGSTDEHDLQLWLQRALTPDPITR